MAFEGRDDRLCKVGSRGWAAGRVLSLTHFLIKQAIVVGTSF